MMLRFRPDAVITTGAAPGYIALLLAKLGRCRTVWLDSIANAEEISMSAQWEEVSRKTPGLQYWGQVL